MTEWARKSQGSAWRWIGWGAAVALLAAPFVAMQMNAEGVYWTAADFIFAGLLFGTVGGLLELAVWKIKNGWYRGGVALMLLGYLLTIWANLAVGIVGSENNPANQLFFAALLVGIVIAVVTRFKAAGMVIAAASTGVSLFIAFAIASAGPTDEPMVRHAVELAGTSIFAGLLFVSAVLFRNAARRA